MISESTGDTENPAAVLGVPVRVPAASAESYEVRIGGGVWHELPRLLGERCPAHRYALITDERVAALHAGPLAERLRSAGCAVDLFSFPAGERHKTRETWARISDLMLEAGIGRDGAVLAVGGGVVGDLAGFVAGTYLRGIPLVQLPTSLLAMIDSSVGGKTGVDTTAGKNLIGCFHQPRLVLADTQVLTTLPRAELRAGLSEAVKHGAIADPDHLEFISARAAALMDADPSAVGALVARSVEIKAGVVAVDERESGPRKSLNFGHTIGHAIEAASEYRLLHGEAIAIGMVLEARLGERLGVTDSGSAESLGEVLERLGSPTRLPAGMSAAELIERTRLDKKSRSGRVEYALIERLGRAASGPDGRWAVPVADEEVLAVLSG